MRTIKYIAFSYNSTGAELFAQLTLKFSNPTHFIDVLLSNYSDINGVVILNTCNRIEVYIESKTTTSKNILEKIEAYTEISGLSLSNVMQSDSTAVTALWLLTIASGLDSPITGDKQIFYQVKNAFLNSANINLQGTLLERLMQNVNQLHKKIVNTTNYYSSTNSYGYLSLKLAKQFIKEHKLQGKVLLIGAGKMIQEVVPYLKNTGLTNVVISNRNSLNAMKIADKYNLATEEYNGILNKLELFDVVVTAVSNQANMINTNNILSYKKQLFIDLASPANIDKDLKNIENKAVIDLSYFNNTVSGNKPIAEAELLSVNGLVNTHHKLFMEWLERYRIGKPLDVLNVKTTTN